MNTVKFAGVSIVFASLLSGIPGQDPKNPHECIGEKAPEIKNALVHLQYDSWVKPIEDGDRFHFDRCVLSHQPMKRLFVDWVDTGAKGVTNDAGLVRGGIESPTKDNEKRKTDLIYGIGRTNSPSTYLEVKAGQARTTPLPGSLRSYAKMGLSLGGKDETNPHQVVDVDIEFESAAMKVGNAKYLYTYSWRDRLADKRREGEAIAVVWPDKFVAQALGKNPSVLSHSSQGAFTTHADAPVFKMVTVEFYSLRAKRSVGTARVSILRPRMPDDKEEN